MKHSVSNDLGFAVIDHKLVCCFKILERHVEPGNVSLRKLILVTLPTQMSQCCRISSCCGGGE